MGRSSTSSCFKIITCGSDSAADSNDVDVLESKSTSDKRGWSFRKRSARHRVLSNTVSSENTSSVKKESPESAELNFTAASNSTIPEKVSIIHVTDEKTQLSTPADGNDSSFQEKLSVVQSKDDDKPQLSSTPTVFSDSTLTEKVPVVVQSKDEEKPQLSATEDLKVMETVVSFDTESKSDPAVDESVVIVIQAAVRGFLVRRELLRQKNATKLQAAFRGHLVRRHAVGTLRCVQAIVKMQALVRARLSGNGSFTKNIISGKDEKDAHSSTITDKGNSGTNVNPSSIEVLLSNKFARQLMDSTPKTKPIHVKCDPAKQDSAWNWLERWMSVSYAKQAAKPESVVEPPEIDSNEKSGSPVEKMSAEVLHEPADSNASIKETIVSESEENLITYDADKFSFQTGQMTSPFIDDLEPSQPEEDTKLSDVKDDAKEATSLQNQITSDTVSQTEPDSVPPEVESEQPERSMKRFANDSLESEGKRFAFGSKKASNPSFLAAQTKFEDLTTSSAKSVSSTHHEDSNMDTFSCGTDVLTKRKESSFVESLVPHFARNVYGGSECGTELSISSTLDSPDISEVGTAEYEHETKVLEKEVSNPNNTDNVDVKADDASSIQVSDVAPTSVNQSNRAGDVQGDDVQGESVDSVVVTDSNPVEHTPERSASDLHKELISETPEASPRSHMTVPESQGTPSSQVSVKARTNKSEKSSSSRKRKPTSAAKGSPSNANNDSGARSSTEQLPRDQKSERRRSSFGSTKNENTDQEPRDSSSSSSLPHFMQATESARAKIQANNSPRSSPDMQDRDIYVKKRHSVTNGRQGSPRIQQSLTQAQQGAKGNAAQPTRERKWQR